MIFISAIVKLESRRKVSWRQ